MALSTTIAADESIRINGSSRALWYHVKIKGGTFPDGGVTLKQDGITLTDHDAVTANQVKAVLLEPGTVEVSSSDWTNVASLTVQLVPVAR